MSHRPTNLFFPSKICTWREGKQQHPGPATPVWAGCTEEPAALSSRLEPPIDVPGQVLDLLPGQPPVLKRPQNHRDPRSLGGEGGYVRRQSPLLMGYRQVKQPLPLPRAFREAEHLCNAGQGFKILQGWDPP